MRNEKKASSFSTNDKGSNNIDKNKSKQKSRIIKGLEDDYSAIRKTSSAIPIEILPENFQLLVKKLELMNAIPDYTVASLLYAVSVSIGNKIRLRVNNLWTENANLYFALVGKPGDGKSHAIKFMLQPLFDIDKEWYTTYEKELADYERSIADASLNIKEDKEVKKPELRQQILSDFTPEAMIKAHMNNKKGVGIYVDEIVGFFNSFDRYKKGNEEESYLAAWSGGHISKVRASTDNARIENISLDIIGTIQPGILKFIFKGKKLLNGFMDRFLFIYPENPPKVRWNDNELSVEQSNQYKSFITNLFSYTENLEKTKNLEFAPDAKNFLYKWQNSNPIYFEFAHERGVEIKLEQYVLRFCIVLHIIKRFSKGNLPHLIDLDTVKSSIKLFSYFKKNAMKVHEDLNANYYESLTDDYKDLYKALPKQFKTGNGHKVNDQLGKIGKSTFSKFIKNDKLFRKLEHGLYEKIID